MKKIILLGFGLCWAGLAGAAELSVDLAFSADDVELTPTGEYTAIALKDGAQPVDEVGAPAIPAKYVNVLLPAGAENVEISASGDWTLLAQDIVPLPAQPPSPKSKPQPAFVSANARYASAAAWPAETATGQGGHEMQGYRFVSVRVNPLAYVGVEKALYLRKKVTVTATYELAPAAKSISAKQRSLFEPLVDSLVVNPSATRAFAPKVRAAEPKAAAADYLIITSAAMSNAFQQLATYRASAAGGSHTTRVTTTNLIGTTYAGVDIQAKIRACISNAVATLGTTMVVLGGDDTIVLDRDCYVAAVGSIENNMPTDLYYSNLDGSWDADGDSIYGETTDAVDLAWDVVVARIPVRTEAQATNYLNKVRAYEAGTPAADQIILGGPAAWSVYSGSGRPTDDVTGDGHAGFRSTSPAHTYVSDSEKWLRRMYRDGVAKYWSATVGIICDTLTSWDGSTCGDYLESPANTQAAFNRNWTHLMFSGHGYPQGWGLESAEYTQANATSLTGLTAFVYTDACMTGHFDKNSNLVEGYSYVTEPCLGESFLRNARGGAVAYIGCARYGWGSPASWDGGPSMVYAYKFYKRLYESTNRTLGVAFAMHKADMIAQSGTDYCERWVQFGLNLLGDPALMMPVAKDRVPRLAVSPAGTNKSVAAEAELNFTVTATDPDGLPVALVVAGLPAGATAPSNNGTGTASTTFAWTPATNQIGIHSVVFSATDDDGTTALGIRIAVAAGGMETFDDFTYAEGTFASGTFPGQDGSTWTYSQVRGDYPVNGSAPTLRNKTNAFVRSGTIDGGVSELSFTYRAPQYSSATKSMSNKFYVIGSDNVYTGTVTEIPISTTEVLTFSATGLEIAGDFVLLFSNTASTAVIAIDDVAWTGYAAVAPSFAALGMQSATAGVETVFALDAAGAPAPTVALRSTTASGGYIFVADTDELSYVPPLADVGVRTFTFTASNVAGVATQTVSVAVASPPPSAPTFHALGAQVAMVGTQKTFTVSATGVPAPTLALRSTTASAGYAFAPGTGALTYAPPEADVGARSFTFTASNGMGVATQTVAVTVLEAAFGGGTETFANFTPSNAFYATGSFAGQDGSTWTYQFARGDAPIDGPAPLMCNTNNTYIRSGTISNGVGTLTFQYRKPYYQTRMGTLVYVFGSNSTYVGTVTNVPDTTNDVLTFTAENVNVAGNFTVLFTNKVTTARIAIDNVTWTGYAGGGGAPPAVNALAAQSVMVGRTLNATVTATPTDGDPILYYACGSSVNCACWTFNTNSGAFAFTPTTNEVGARQFDFTAADKDGASAPVTLTVSVNPPPTMSGFGSPTNGAGVSAVVASLTGMTYALQYSTNLIATNWVPADSKAGTGSNLTLLDGHPTNLQRFYRVVVP
jgi:hypothetical protein